MPTYGSGSGLDQDRCFNSVSGVSWSRSESERESRVVWIRIAWFQCVSGDLMTKHCKILQLEKILYFWSKVAIFTVFISSYCTREASRNQPSKETICLITFLFLWAVFALNSEKTLVGIWIRSPDWVLAKGLYPVSDLDSVIIVYPHFC